jgi:hypothetical protein
MLVEMAMVMLVKSSVHNNVNGMLLLQLSTWCELSLRLRVREILDGDW